MQTLREYALRFVGVPYLWGGQHPANGLDCSGFAQVLLRSVGLDPPGDQNAQALFDHLCKNGNQVVGPQMGHFLFFGQSVTKITHIAMALDPYRMIEAGGGGSATTDLAAAIKAEAFIRISLIKRRQDLVAIVKPNYSSIGQTI